MKNKKKISIIALCLMSAIAVTYAIFKTEFSVKNKFKINNASAEFIEEFNAPKEGEIVAGKTYEKNGKVINNGDVAVKARAKISISWLGVDGNPVDDTKKPDGELDPSVYAYTLDFGGTISNEDALEFQNALATNGDKFDVKATGTAANKWVYDATDNYFYYFNKDTGKIAAGDTSGKLLESITFNNELATVETTKNYYVNDGNFTNAFDSQEKAKAADTNNLGIVYKEVSTMKYSEYKNLTLVVTLAGEIVDVDTAWS